MPNAHPAPDSRSRLARDRAPSRTTQSLRAQRSPSCMIRNCPMSLARAFASYSWSTNRAPALPLIVIPSSAFIYARVLEGAIRSKVNEEPERTYQVGESWTEKPGDHHQVSHNASSEKPAKLLATFIVDTSDRKIVIPDE